MRRWIALGSSFGLLWLFVRGVDLAPQPIGAGLLTGLGVGLPIAFLFRRFYRQDLDLIARLLGGRFAVIYVVLFLKELLTANLDVAYRVLRPSMPIEPDVVEFPLRVQTDAAITTIANSVTLTPGTLTMDYDDDGHALYIHTIDSQDRSAVVEPIRRWEDYALRIFDEPLDPEDEPQQATEHREEGESDGE